MKKILTFSSILLTAACSTTGYVVPEGKSTAELRLVAVPSNNNFVFINDGIDCIKPEFKAGGEVAVLGTKANLMTDRQAGRVLGMPLYRDDIAEKQQTELKVEANTPISFSFAGVGISSILPTSIGYSYCMQKIDFVPEEGNSYEAEYFMTKIDGKKTCAAKLYTINDIDGEFKKVEHKNYKLTTKLCK